jgi:hypothetical protein
MNRSGISQRFPWHIFSAVVIAHVLISIAIGTAGLHRHPPRAQSGIENFISLVLWFPDEFVAFSFGWLWSSFTSLPVHRQRSFESQLALPRKVDIGYTTISHQRFTSSSRAVTIHGQLSSRVRLLLRAITFWCGCMTAPERQS